MKYEFSYDGLENAINDRKHHLKVCRRTLIILGVIACVGILNLPSASIVAFTTI